MNNKIIKNYNSVFKLTNQAIVNKIVKAILLGYFIFFISCKEYSLKYMPEKGMAFDYQIEAKTFISQRVAEQDVVIENTVNIILANKVTNTQPDLVTIESYYKYIDMLVNTGTKSYFSSNDTTQTKADNNNDIGAFLPTITNKPFTILVNHKGKVEQITGFDSIKYHMNLIDADLTKKQQLIQSIEKQFGHNALKSIFENFTAVYPPHIVKVGDSWKLTNKIYGSYIINTNNTLTLKSLKNDIAKITYQSDIDAFENDNTSEIGGVIIKTSLSGKQSGYVTINTAENKIIRGEINQVLKGNVKIYQLRTNIEIPVKINIKLKLSSI